MPATSNQQPATIFSFSATSDQQPATIFSSPATSNQQLATLLSPPATSNQQLATVPAGFTMIEMIGVLAVLSIMVALITPNLIDQLDRAAQDLEEASLKTIGQGVESYLRANEAWPANLAALSPDFVPFGNTQLSTNDRGYTRYFFAHPDSSSFSNGTGLAQSALADMRFLLISNVNSDASPTINNSNQFDTWWNTDETSTPDLKIYRGHISQLFHLVSVSAVGTGGSYRIAGTSTSSGGGTLSLYSQYHLVGTVVEFDESNNFSPGNIAFSFSLTADSGYQFNPNCSGGYQWTVLGQGCPS